MHTQQFPLINESASIDEVASAIGKSASWLKRHYARFSLEHGFPHPLPGGGWRWPRRAVELWLVAGGVIRSGANNNAPGADLISLQNASLKQRYGAKV